jgi:hypothetical protein
MRYCNDIIDMKDIPQFIEGINDSSESTRRDAYALARKHRNCKQWNSIAQELERRWNIIGPSAPKARERAEIINLWATVMDYSRARSLITYWTSNPDALLDPLSGRIHGFMMDFAYSDPNRAFTEIEKALGADLLAYSKELSQALLSIFHKIFNQTDPKPSSATRKKGEALFATVEHHQEAFPIIKEIRKDLFPYS